MNGSTIIFFLVLNVCICVCKVVVSSQKAASTLFNLASVLGSHNSSYQKTKVIFRSVHFFRVFAQICHRMWLHSANEDDLIDVACVTSSELVLQLCWKLSVLFWPLVSSTDTLHSLALTGGDIVGNHRKLRFSGGLTRTRISHVRYEWCETQ